MNAENVLAAVKAAYYQNTPRRRGEWVFFPEMRAGTGYGPGVENRMDAWIMNTWPSKRLMRIVLEVKVSRSDFFMELRNPHKREKALLFSNLFYFAAPAGLIQPDEVPPEAGLMEVTEAGRVKTTVKAPWRPTPEPTWRFVAALLRRADCQRL